MSGLVASPSAITAGSGGWSAGGSGVDKVGVDIRTPSDNES